MERQLKATGVFLGLVFLAAGIINAFKGFIAPDAITLSFLRSFSFWILIVCAILLIASGYVHVLAWIQPAVMLGITPIPFQTTHDSFYGLGFFVMGVLLLFRLGFYDRHRIPKFVASIGYLFACELYAALKAGRGIYYALTPIFFMTCFLVFLYLAFKEKLAVYLREPKPVLSLKTKGLSGSECIYIKAIAEGQSPKEVAISYSVSESTVRNSLSRAYRKLGIEDKSAIAAMAEKFELVD